MSINGNIFKPLDLERILQRVRDLKPDSPRRWGSMTVNQALCHQADSLEIALGRRAPERIRAPLPLPIMRFFALRLPRPWPRGLRTVPEADPDALGSQPAGFDRDRHRLEALLEEFSELPVGEPTASHPLFGPMSRANWGRWAYRHSDHHLRQFGG